MGLTSGCLSALFPAGSKEMIFVDESAANERTKDRKYGWAPIGVRPTEHRPHERSER